MNTRSVVAIALLSAVICACGKKNDPEPREAAPLTVAKSEVPLQCPEGTGAYQQTCVSQKVLDYIKCINTVPMARISQRDDVITEILQRNGSASVGGSFRGPIGGAASAGANATSDSNTITQIHQTFFPPTAGSGVESDSCYAISQPTAASDEYKKNQRKIDVFNVHDAFDTHGRVDFTGGMETQTKTAQEHYTVGVVENKIGIVSERFQDNKNGSSNYYKSDCTTALNKLVQPYKGNGMGDVLLECQAGNCWKCTLHFEFEPAAGSEQLKEVEDKPGELPSELVRLDGGKVAVDVRKAIARLITADGTEGPYQIE